MNQLLLVDDDHELCQLLKEYLEAEGFTVDMAHDGGAGLEKAQSGNYDAVVLDVMLPVHNGFEVLKKLREFSQTPVLMLTAKGEAVDRIVGLEIGADDYLPKPCNPRELVARIRAILRRTEGTQQQRETPDVLELEHLSMHLGNRTTKYNREEVQLTGAEFTVLELLLRSPGQVMSKEFLTEQALGRKLTAYDRSIDVHVSNIRKKLSKAGASRDLIINIRGSGYMLTVNE